MRFQPQLLTLWVGAVLAASQSIDDDIGVQHQNGFIVEYSRNADLQRQSQSLQGRPGIKVVKEFQSQVFNGLSVTTDGVDTVETLRDLPGVVKIWPNGYAYPAPIERSAAASQELRGNWTSHSSTGVEKLHKQGIYGKGVKIGVVDSGVDYTHPALGAGFGDGFKIAGGWDLVGDGTFPNGPREPDDDPMDKTGHGTHVSGIIAGQNDQWQGVAPQASLYAYKVFNGDDPTTYDVVIEAFLQAFEDGMDIITASIIGPSGWADHAWAEVASRLVEEGVVVTISGGNSGTFGPFNGDSGASGRNVLAVASVDADSYPLVPFYTEFSTNETSDRTLNGYIPGTGYFPPVVKGWPIVALSYNTSVVGDACEALPDDTPSLASAVALVRRGGCSMALKQTNLEAVGARYILIYNDGNEMLAPITDSEISLVAMITAEAGASIIDALVKGTNVTADFSENPEAVIGVDYPTAGKPSYFSSWSALWDLTLKPDIAAPGGNIYSTGIGGIFLLSSGTSMACPYVAGVAALYIGLHGGRHVHGKGFAKVLHQRIISSGTSLPWAGYPGSQPANLLAPPAQVGNGLIDAWKVIKYTTRLDFDKISLNDTRNFRGTHEVTILNDGPEEVKYTLSAEHGAGVEVLGWFVRPNGGPLSKRLKALNEVVPVTLDVSVKLPCPITIQPGESTKIPFENPENRNWNTSAMPMYGGKILVRGNNGEQLAVPFFGVGSDVRGELDTINVAGFPYAVTGANNTRVLDGSTFSFDLSLEKQGYPRLFNNIIWGTRELRWDIFESGWTETQWSHPLVVGENGYVGSATSWSGAIYGSPIDPAVDDPEDVMPFPLTNLWRNTASSAGTRYHWLGKLANGTQISKGRYVMRFAALKPFGDPRISGEWDVYQVARFEVTGRDEQT